MTCRLRLAEDRDQPAAPLDDRSFERIEDRSELCIPADHGGIQSPGVGIRAGDDIVESKRVDGFRLAFRIDRLDRFRHDRVPDQAVGGLSDQDLAGGGRLLQSGRGVDRISGHERLAPARVA